MWSIPKDVINDDEDLREKARKLIFYSTEELIVINKEGIEKKVSIEKNFQDISSYVIPFFEPGSGHYFVDPDIPD